jgi:hypothetical protein
MKLTKKKCEINIYDTLLYSREKSSFLVSRKLRRTEIHSVVFYKIMQVSIDINIYVSSILVYSNGECNYSFSDPITSTTDEPETNKGVNNVAGVQTNHSHVTTWNKFDDVISSSEHCDKCHKTVNHQYCAKVTMEKVCSQVQLFQRSKDVESTLSYNSTLNTCGILRHKMKHI